VPQLSGWLAARQPGFKFHKGNSSIYPL